MLGYDSVDGKLVPNDDAKIIRLIFQLYLEDRSPSQVAEALKSVGIVGRNGKPLTINGISYILNNKVYVVDKLLQKRAPKNFLTKQPEKPGVAGGADFKSLYFFDDHEGIIDREMWEAVQCKLRDHSRNNHNNGLGNKGSEAAGGVGSGGLGAASNGNSHPLYGLIICSNCGSLLTRRTHYSSRKNKTTHKVWICKEKYKGRHGNGCQMRAVKETELLTAIESQAEAKLGVQFSWQEVVKDIKKIVVSRERITVFWKIGG